MQTRKLGGAKGPHLISLSVSLAPALVSGMSRAELVELVSKTKERDTPGREREEGRRREWRRKDTLTNLPASTTVGLFPAFWH